MTMPSGYEHLPAEMNVPFECTSCGGLFNLFGPEDMSDLCSCVDPMYRLFVSDAGAYQPVVEAIVDTAEATLRAWSELTRDDLEEG